MKMKLNNPQYGIKEPLFLTAEKMGSFDGYCPEENEIIKSLRKAAERNEIKLL